MMATSPSRTIEELENGAHICNIYENETEHRAMMSDLFRLGFEHGEKILYITDTKTSEMILEFISNNEIGIESYLKTGQLNIFNIDDKYKRDGLFDNNKIRMLLQNETERAIAGGYTGLRVIHEMSCALNILQKPAQLIEYETLVNSFIPGSNCRVICLYNRDGLDSKLMLDVLAVHPSAVIGNKIYDNHSFLTSTDIPAKDNISIITQNWLKNLSSRKRTDEELQYYYNAVKVSPDSIVFSDLEGRILDVNDAAFKMYELENRRDLLGQNYFEFIVPEERDKAVNDLEKVLINGNLRSQDYSVTTRAGSTISVETDIDLMTNKNGDPIGFIGIARDITERKRAVAMLHESDERYRHLFDQSPFGIGISSLDGKVITANKAMQTITGYTEKELVEINITDLYEDPEERKALLDMLKRNGSVVEYSARLKRKDSTSLDALLSILRIKLGEKEYLHTIYRDITECNKPEETLRKRLQIERIISKISANLINFKPGELDEIINGALEEIARFTGTVRGSVFLVSENGTVITNTHEWCADPQDSQISLLHGFPADKFGYYLKLLRKLETVVISRPGDLPPEAHGERKWIKSHGFRPLLFVPMVQDGALYGTVGFYGKLNEELDWPQEAIGQLSILSDILINTLERKRAEDELLKHREHLEDLVSERTSELESFAFTVSHDLKAPLRTIQSFAQILLDDHGENLDAEGKDYTSRIVNSSQNLINIIQDMLAYSRLSSVELKPERMNLNEITQDVLKQLEAEIEERDAVVEVEQSLPIVVGHKATLSKIISNLLFNAIKFVDTDVKPHVKIWAEVHDGKVRLYVEDNGIGIEAEYQARIFRIFERLHGCETYPGTGIGLAIVRKGIERLGGKVGVESEPGKGSRFWIELDMAE